MRRCYANFRSAARNDTLALPKSLGDQRHGLRLPNLNGAHRATLGEIPVQGAWDQDHCKTTHRNLTAVLFASPLLLERTHHLMTTISDLHVDMLLHRYYVATVLEFDTDTCCSLESVSIVTIRCEHAQPRLMFDDQVREFLSLVR